MQYEFAPLEGITGYIYRNAHHACFPSMDRYYTPFITPKKGKSFTTREWNDIAAEHNQNIAVVPQILTNQAEGFCKVAGMLKEQGYEEVNLNLGCPSATVTAKKKGAGFLADPDALDAFLEEIFAHSPLKISIKTRIGVENPDEFERLLDIFSQYPIQKLIVHPRVLKEFYKGNVHREAYVRAKERLSAAAADVETVGRTIPVCYNGDLVSERGIREMIERYPSLSALMLGRGLLGDPSLVTRVRGGERAGSARLQAFHDTLFARYCDAFGDSRIAVLRMKELWFYFGNLFENSEKLQKSIKKAKNAEEFERAAAALFCSCEVRGNAVPAWFRPA